MKAQWGSAQAIVAELERPVGNRIPLMDRLRRSAKIADLIEALQLASSTLTKQLLCDLLGQRSAVSALPALIGKLSDRSPRVRSSAADAIGKIHIRRAIEPLARYRAGDAIASRLDRERDPSVRSTLIAAAGATLHRGSIDVIRQSASDPRYATVASWALGRLETDVRR